MGRFPSCKSLRPLQASRPSALWEQNRASRLICWRNQSCLRRVDSSEISLTVPIRAGGSAGVRQRELPRGVAARYNLHRVGGHIELQDGTPVMGQNQKYVKDLEPDGGTVKKSIETSCWAWFSRKVRQV